MRTIPCIRKWHLKAAADIMQMRGECLFIQKADYADIIAKYDPAGQDNVIQVDTPFTDLQADVRLLKEKLMDLRQLRDRIEKLEARPWDRTA